MADPGETNPTNETSAEGTSPAQGDAVPVGGGEGDVSVPPVHEEEPGRQPAPPTSSDADAATVAAPGGDAAPALDADTTRDADSAGTRGDDAPALGAPDADPASSYWLASAEAGAPTVHQTPEPPPAGPRPTAAPNPISGIRTGTAPEAPAPADEPRRPSIVPRIAAVLVMLVFAAAVGYGLAFLSAQLVGQTGSSQPAGSAASAGTSVAPGGTSAGATSTTVPATSASSTGSAAVSPSLAGRTAPAASTRFHVVARGETLTSIAARYGVSVGALAAANGITNPNTIYAGQRLVIPGP